MPSVLRRFTTRLADRSAAVVRGVSSASRTDVRRFAPAGASAIVVLVLLGTAVPTLGLPFGGSADTGPGAFQLAPDHLDGDAAEPFRVPDPLPTGLPTVVVHGSGWGHSVGMSQYGAQAMALAGHGYRDILGHYYRGIDVTAYPGQMPERIRVGLFHKRPIDHSVLQLSTSSRDGNRPTREAVIVLGGSQAPVALPFGQIWTLRHDGDAFVLRDRAGVVRGQGPGPARVEFAHTDASPTLLRLPQLGDSGRTREAGTFQWGHLEVTARDGQLRPTLVVPLERYLRGLAEMPSGWHVEALKAQAITGRTYAVRQIRNGTIAECDCHLSTTPFHQAYSGWAKEGTWRGQAWVAAVRGTAGAVALYEGELAWTYYSSSHAASSEAAHESWAYPSEIPYLQPVDDAWSDDPAVRNPYRSWRREFTNAEFARAIGTDIVVVRGVEVAERTDGGTPRVLQVRGLTADGREVTRTFRGFRKGIAGSDLKLHFRSRLPSQQITSIGMGPFDDGGSPHEWAVPPSTAAP